ncbi:MAG TPA: hypothetical protein VGC01_05535 [Mucilaginibacter sp.]
MKKVFQILFVALISTFIFSCAGMKGAVAPAGPPRSAFTGTWTLTNVSYSGLVEGSVQTVFDQAPPQDFVNSTWELTNSGNGTYTLANGTAQNIYWSVNSGDALGAIFQFKKINQGESPKNVTKGYQLVISNNDATSMTLKSLVYFGNQNGYVVYTFTKK